MTIDGVSDWHDLTQALRQQVSQRFPKAADTIRYYKVKCYCTSCAQCGLSEPTIVGHAYREEMTAGDRDHCPTCDDKMPVFVLETDMAGKNDQ